MCVVSGLELTTSRLQDGWHYTTEVPQETELKIHKKKEVGFLWTFVCLEIHVAANNVSYVCMAPEFNKHPNIYLITAIDETRYGVIGWLVDKK